MDELSHRLRAFVERLVAEEPVSAVSVLVGSADRVAGEAFAGRLRAGSPGKPDRHTLFDLASLTKPCMAALALLLERQGLCSLEQTIGDMWSKASPPLADKTLPDLLRHRAGFQAWAPLYQLCKRPEEVVNLLLDGRFLAAESDPYSDLDYILWGLATEARVGRPLADLVATHLGPLLAPESLVAKPAADLGVAECLLDTRREVELASAQGIDLALHPPPDPGQPQDGNARFLGGLGGHAGLFATSRALWALAREWLQPRTLAAEDVEKALSGAGPYLQGWRRPRENGRDGEALGPEAFGHTGFTGGSVWIDPGRDRIFVLLAHRTVVTAELDPWRRELHELAF
ncbi:MAG: serine hydrolase domain-containing protein [Thermoanaerobaculia bacterium]